MIVLTKPLADTIFTIAMTTLQRCNDNGCSISSDLQIRHGPEEHIGVIMSSTNTQTHKNQHTHKHTHTKRYWRLRS